MRRDEFPDVRHPGEILREDFMAPFEISQNALARATGLSPRRINQIVNGTRSITAATAVAFEETIGPTAEVWLALQADYDIARARHQRARMGRPAVKPLPDWSEPLEEPEHERPKYADWRFNY